ncbi:hypothetical protein I4U23_015272 [Adineta vaga]|nr:hypothetical protein I4U23_015272 [Adineta vaga]
MSKIGDSKYECNDSDCSSSKTVSVSDLRHCEIACLVDITCRTLTYDQSNNACQLFVDSPNERGNMLAQTDILTLIVLDNRPAPIVCTSMFYNQSTYGTGSSPLALAVGDVTGDMNVDIVTVNYMSNTISVLFNTGNGTFLPHAQYTVGSYPGSA